MFPYIAVNAGTGGNRFTNADPWDPLVFVADSTVAATDGTFAATGTTGMIGAGDDRGGSLCDNYCRILNASTRTQFFGAAAWTTALLCPEIFKHATRLV